MLNRWDRVSIASRIATQAGSLRIDDSMLVDIDRASAAVTSLDHATDIVNQERSYLGSMQDRLAPCLI